MIKITIDTSVISEEEGNILEYLVSAHISGLIDVAVASRFKMDKENDINQERVEKQQKIVSKLHLIPSTFRIGLSYTDDEMGILADDNLHQQLFCLFDIDTNTRGGQHTIWDVDHLYSHMIQDRDVFLTFEGKFIKKRAILKDIGANIAHPIKFIDSMKSIASLHSTHTSQFRYQLFDLLDRIHNSQPNPQLQRRLNAMREAQENIKAGRFTQEDEKVIRYIATKFRSFKTYPSDIAAIKARNQYPAMKTSYLSRYPSYKINATNIIRGLNNMYNRETEN